MANNAAARRFVIKPFRPHSQMDEEQAKGIWASLQLAIDEIYNKNASVLSFEELYRNAYNLVLHKHGELLYEGVHETVKSRLREVANRVAATQDDELLNELAGRWSDHHVTMVMVRDILMYMDRTFVPQNKKMAVFDLGLKAFRDTIARHDQVQMRLQALLLDAVKQERQGRGVEHGLIKSTLYMLTDLGIDSNVVYEDDFEAAFLRETREFYKQESTQYLASNTCPDYMLKVEERLAEESQRVADYLNPTTGPKLILLVECVLISDHSSTLVGTEKSGFDSLLAANKMEDLRRMHDLFARIPAKLDALRTALHDHVRRAGLALVAAHASGGPASSPVEFLEALLRLRDKFDAVVQQAFRGENAAQKRLKEAFEAFVNADTKCAHALVAYIDDLMKSGFKGHSEAEVELMLDKVLVLFRYLQDKDVFEAFYKTALSKRLLGNRSLSFEAERQMIAKLKGECGYQYTSKLEGMFTDMKFSKDAMEKFKAHRQAASARDAVDVDVTMLTAGYWPLPGAPACPLPPQAAACAKAYEAFYLVQHTGRKLTWQTAQGTAELKATFEAASTYHLTVTTFQMCILMLFNAGGPGGSAPGTPAPSQLTLAQIAEATAIPSSELKRHIVSLSTPKHRILNKESKGKGVADDDVFTVNAKFTSKLKRVRVPLVASKETGPADDAVANGIEQGRRHMTEATVVRIMKARKTLKHNDLIAEVTRQLANRFHPQPHFIKKCVEALIEREYLERSEADCRLYTYLA
ncbi:Cullin [Pelagophyceae sp. CCMP2097]|nr:Cullin [Pelagophyceae sp. CCMP2097]|mmetsp:Transcript_13858/g.46228  ORF Transcript_13858/g.46228 Transcript_13858/m.46228 type:complete len:752 (+) Transcript_13858:236-2491(+)